MRSLIVFCAIVLWTDLAQAQTPTQVAADDATFARLASLEKAIAARTSDLNEMKRQRSELLKLTKPAASFDKLAGAKPLAPKPVELGTGDFRRFQQKLLRENSYYKPETVTKEKPPEEKACEPQQLWYIRADSLDNYLYGITPTSKAVGASVSFTNDQVAKTQNVSINGMVSYVALRHLCPDTSPGDAPYISGYSIAPYVQGKGSLTSPRSKKEQSVTKVGIEAEIEVSRGFPLRQIFTIAPYYLSDYRGEARAQGMNAYWDVYDANLHLGGYVSSNPYLDWFVQLRGEADIRDVNAVGVTNLDKTQYAWVGGTVRASFFLFPSYMDVDPALRNRLSFIGEASWFNDARTGNQIHKYVATAKYNISALGNSSIQLEYSHGTDKDTLVYLNQILVKLTYAY